MKLILKNFRCHVDTTFELPDAGLVLLSGNSGLGKSTILKAILYALFGNRAVKKPYSFGTTSCSVRLEFMNIKIQRTNRPNRLVVDELEDDAAQAFIDEKLGGGYEEFLLSSYIPQKNNNSILSLAQTEQLQMIRTLSFDREQNEHYKKRLKEMIRGSSEALIKKRTELQFIEGEIKAGQSLEIVEFPLKGEDETAVIEAYYTRLKGYPKRLENMLGKREKLVEKQHKTDQLETEYETINDKLGSIEDRLEDAKAKKCRLKGLLQDVPDDLKRKIEELGNEISYLELKRELASLKEQYSQIAESEAEVQKRKQERLKAELWKDGDEKTTLKELETARELIKDWKRYRQAVEELEELQNELELDLNQQELLEHYTGLVEDNGRDAANLYKKRERLTVAAERLALEKEIVYCPECETPLHLRNKKLVTVHDHQPVEERDYTSEIRKLVKELKKCERRKTEYADILQEINAIHIPELGNTDYKKLQKTIVKQEKYLSENKLREEELKQIEEELSADYQSPALKSIQKQIDDKDSDLDGIDIEDEPTEEIDELRKRHTDYKKAFTDYQGNRKNMLRVKSELETLNEKQTELQGKLGMVEKKLSKLDKKAVGKELKRINKEIEDLKKLREKDERLYDQVEKYKDYCAQRETIDRWRKKLDTIDKELKDAEKTHTADLTLKDRYNQAEIMTLETTAHSINEHTRYYLESFFIDNGLSAELKAVRKGKKSTNLKIETIINYKGHEYDSIHQLSGGEFDRCTLASVCGINSMLASPLLMLDESLSSLDTDTNTEIIRFLNELSQDKLIIVCSHEAVRGIFDTIIEL